MSDWSTPRAYAGPIVVGLAIAAAGLLPWTWLSSLNARIFPEWPWAAAATVLYLGMLIAWLDGHGWPRRTAAARRTRLRLRWAGAERDADRAAMSPWAIVLVLAALYAIWTAAGRLSPVPDLAGYPTTAYRWSMFVMGGIVSGVVEEIAFRGYMQAGLERHDPGNAVWITSLVFVAAHITQGPAALLVLGPGLFVASVLYGQLVRRTGTILPGMLVHVLGDLCRVYFGVLRGDASLLFVGSTPAE